VRLRDTQAVSATPPHTADLQILRKVVKVSAGKIQPWNLELIIYQGSDLAKYQKVELWGFEPRPLASIPGDSV
jgi:hypothetical protein